MSKTTRNKLIMISFFIALSLASVNFISAQTDQNTKTAVETLEEVIQEASPSTTNSLKERIEKAVEGQASNDSQNQEQADGQEKKGFVGEVTRVSEEAITIENSKGSQIIPITETTDVTKQSEAIELNDIAIEDDVIVMGFTQEDDFQTVKVVVTEQELLPAPQLIVIGSLTDISQSAITVKARSSQDKTKIKINNDTTFEDASSEAIESTALFEDLQVLIAGYIEIEEDENAQVIDETKTALIVRSLAPVE